MSPELQLMLSEMHQDIRETRDRVRSIELVDAGRDGAEKMRHRVGELVKFAAMMVAAAFTGHIGGSAH